MIGNKGFLKSTGFKLLLAVVILLAGFMIRGRLEEKYDEMNQPSGTAQNTEDEYSDGERVGRELDYAPDVPDDNKILLAFKEQFPQAEVLVACEEDVTDDGHDDLVVVCRMEDSISEVKLIVAIDSGDGANYIYTEPIPAPVENQKIKFQDIDKKDEIEFVLQGEKGSKVGYGIFRVMDGQVVNLFGEGMEDC